LKLNGPIESGDWWRVRYPGIGTFRYRLTLGLPGLTLERGTVWGWETEEREEIRRAVLRGHPKEIIQIPY